MEESIVSKTLRAEASRIRKDEMRDPQERRETAERLELAATWIEAVAFDDAKRYGRST